MSIIYSLNIWGKFNTGSIRDWIFFQLILTQALHPITIGKVLSVESVVDKSNGCIL